MIARLFSPTLSYRLFDPMPLPKAKRVLRTRPAMRNQVIGKVLFAATIKKIPQDK